MRSFDFEEFFGKPVEVVFDPSSCPAVRLGKPLNLDTAPAELTEDPKSGGSVVDPRRTYAWMAFGKREDDGNFGDMVQTDEVALDAGDPLFPVVKELGRNPEDPRIDRARQAFCDRAHQCRGPVNDECWALGEQAVRQVFRETLL